MAIRLIFLSWWWVTNARSYPTLLDSEGSACVPGNSPHVKPVPETDTGGQVEYTKALERTMLKELGKLPS
jgi:hypothetical protein